MAYKEGIFNPQDITSLLGIQPFNSWAYSSKRRGGSTRRFSTWDTEKSDVDRLDVEAQCRDTIKT